MQSMKPNYIHFLLFFILISPPVIAQRHWNLTGTIINREKQPMAGATVTVNQTKIATSTNAKGTFYLQIPTDKSITITVTHIGYQPYSQNIFIGNKNSKTLNITLITQPQHISEVVVHSNKNSRTKNTVVNVKNMERLPTVGAGAVEQLIKTLPGVASNNELSNQYAVRGGNFDENLVYINEIAMYRPKLTRSGQQEGLSIINPDMVSNIQFSAGAFDAHYGDKMASVLDIKYKNPTDFSATANISLLETSAYVANRHKRFSYAVGTRYKNSRYLLKTLDTKGGYQPNFMDIQALLSYKINDKISIDFWGTYNRNNYNFTPSDRNTSFGTISNALNLKIYFDGSENDKFIANSTALTVKYHPNADNYLRLIANRYYTKEQERFDIMGQYYLNDLFVSKGGAPSSELEHLGIGTFIDHARNQLTQKIQSLQLKGDHNINNLFLQWGVGIKTNHLNNTINEWQYQDSAGYAIPISYSDIRMAYARNAKNKIRSHKIHAFAQATKVVNTAKGEFQITGGIRYKRWNYNGNNIISPRFSIHYIPKWKHKLRFKFATGYYQQMPSYREMLAIDGKIAGNLKAQKSIHYVLGQEYYFKLWNRPFKLTSELFYKDLQAVIPYDMENVRIRYYGEERAEGYAAGIDFRMNGEFVKGIESWVSLSILKTEEDIIGDKKGSIPRPSDQRFNFALCFQDYLPNNPSYKMYLMLMYGGKIPVWTPKHNKAGNYFRMPNYRRVDLGFSKVLINKNHQAKGFLRSVKSMWIGLEIFNILDIKNTVSYLWVKDYSGNQYAVPNYLTGRKINVKLSVKF